MALDLIGRKNVMAASIIAIFAVLIMSVTAAGLSKPGYAFGLQFLSYLGVDNAGALWFNAGMVVAGALLIVFFASRPSDHEKALDFFGDIFGVVSAISLAAVGIFPADTLFAHLAASTAFFAFSALSVSAITISEYGRRNQFRPRMFAGSAYVLFAIVFLASGYPVLENLSVALLGLWMVVQYFAKVRI
jgi:hypothetical membrane protein